MKNFHSLKFPKYFFLLRNFITLDNLSAKYTLWSNLIHIIIFWDARSFEISTQFLEQLNQIVILLTVTSRHVKCTPLSPILNF